MAKRTHARTNPPVRRLRSPLRRAMFDYAAPCRRRCSITPTGAARPIRYPASSWRRATAAGGCGLDVGAIDNVRDRWCRVQKRRPNRCSTSATNSRRIPSLSCGYGGCPSQRRDRATISNTHWPMGAQGDPDLSCRELALDCVQEADELLVGVFLHAAVDDHPVEDVAQERAAGRNLGRSGFRKCRLEHPQRTDEEVQGPQRLSSTPGRRDENISRFSFRRRCRCWFLTCDAVEPDLRSSLLASGR